MAPLLSICIPTYNRRDLLAIALDSLAPCLGDFPVEIVISDNASTDGTEEMVRGLAQAHPGIHYFRNPLNVGFDSNLVKVIERAKGEYCWLLGSDDAMAGGAISAIFECIKGRPDLILGDAINCDFKLNPIGPLKFLGLAEESLYFSETKDITKFLQSATMHASLFGYIGALIFRRASVLRYVPNNRYMGTGYIHVSLALDVLMKGAGVLHYLARPLAFARRDNHDYLGTDREKAIRHFIDYQMFRRVQDDYFNDSLDLHNCYRAYIRRIYGIASTPLVPTGIDFVDGFRDHFFRDATALPSAVWQLSATSESVWKRLTEAGWHDRLFSHDNILQIGFRDGFDIRLRPINKFAIGYDAQYGGSFDGLHLPFEDESQNVVWICHTLAYFPDLAAASLEWLRVLQPGGRLVISSKVRQSRAEIVKVSTSANPSPLDILSLLSGLLANGALFVVHVQQTAPVTSDDSHNAVSDMDVILEKLPASRVAPEVAIQAAFELHREGQLQLADSAYTSIVANAAEYFPAVHMLGVVRMQQNDLISAESLLRKAISINGVTPEAHYNLGMVLLQLSRTSEASNCFQRCLEIQPGFALAQARLAELARVES